MIYCRLCYLCTVICAFILCPSLQAQDVLWEKSYGGKQAEFLFDAQPTPDYGFILAGSSLSKKSGSKTDDGYGNFDYWIWKMDEGGGEDWQKSYGGTGSDMLYSIRSTKDGGFILGGTSDSQPGLHKKDSCRGAQDFWVIKLDAKGGEQWQKTIGGSGSEQLKSICQTTDGGYIIGGSSSSDISLKVAKGGTDPYNKWEKNRGNMDYWIVKLDDKGNVKWQRTLGGKYADVLESIQQTSDGGYIVGGHSNSPSSQDKTEDGYGAGDYWVLKLDKDGLTEWQKTFGGEADDHLYEIRQLRDGGYIIGGNSASGSTGNKSKTNKNGTDFWLIRLDVEGEVVWQETYNNGKSDILTSLTEDESGSFMLGGYSKSEVTGLSKSDKKEINDYVALKINAKGEELWKKVVGSNGEDILRKMIETRDGGYIMAGTSKGKVSRDRNSGKGSNDFWVVKLKDKDKQDKGENKSSIEALPNPAQQFTNIIIGYEYATGTANVYDMGGRQVQSFALNGDRTVPVDLGGYAQGIYVIEITTNMRTDSVKVIKGKN